MDDYFADMRMSEARVAAAYAQLALLENSRRVSRDRERKQRSESLPLTRAPSVGALLPSKISNDKGAEAESLLLKLRHAPLSLETLSFESHQLTSCVSKILRNGVHHNEHHEHNVEYGKAANVCLHEHRRICRAIAELHQQLLKERGSRRRLQAAALSAGVRSANAAKRLARAAQATASTERILARRDALREARESPAVSIYAGHTKSSPHATGEILLKPIFEMELQAAEKKLSSMWDFPKHFGTILVSKKRKEGCETVQY